MGLHNVKTFSKFVATLPAVTLVEQWESHVAKVGGKVFALINLDGEHMAFKVMELSFEGLTAIDGIAQAPYFAKRAWVSVRRGADIADADLKAYVAASHRMVAGKLTKKLRAELRLTEL
ncbi:MAG: MmcQ/YjbR family DNA-binding protein [Devosia sp.]